MDLRDAAQELYTVSPRDFTTERAALVRTAKEAGNKDLAKDISALPKPAAGAWAINMLAVHKPEVIDGVVRFGVSLRKAQEDGDAEAFRELGQQRQGQLTAAVHAAKDLASELGAPLSAAAASDVEQTFRAAMADAGAATAVGTGRLVRGLSGSGFEAVDLTGAIAATGPEDERGPEAEKAPAKPAAKTEHTPRSKSAPPSKDVPSKEKAPPQKSSKDEATSLADRRAAKQKAALEEARSEFEAADQTAKEAEAAASAAWDTVNEFGERRTNLKSEIEDLKKRLSTLEAELIGITRDAEAAESDKKRAVRAATQQRRAADQAQRRIDRLS
jgi:outer membrane biosynthesis protein TonB